MHPGTRATHAEEQDMQLPGTRCTAALQVAGCAACRGFVSGCLAVQVPARLAPGRCVFCVFCALACLGDGEARQELTSPNSIHSTLDLESHATALLQQLIASLPAESPPTRITTTAATRTDDDPGAPPSEASPR